MKLKITDYNIYSKKIYKSTLITFVAIVITTCIAEYFFDLATTSLTILTPYLISGILLLFFSIKYPKTKMLRWILIFLLFSMLETHFIVNPKAFHIISFWLIFIPIITLIILGIRQAFIVFLLVFSTQILNFVFLTTTVDDSYELLIKVKPLFAISSIFIFGNVFLHFYYINYLAMLIKK